jgi:hypothetical protein
MDHERADVISMLYGKGKIHYAARHLPYYADLLPSLVVHEMRPRQARPDSLYVTNGLSAPNADSALGYGFELQMIAPADEAWPITLLISLAANTVRTNTQFGVGQVIALTHSLADLELTAKSLLFTCPAHLPDTIALSDGLVRLVTVVGMTADEYEWAKRHSASDRMARFQPSVQSSVPRRRSSGVKYTPDRRSA